MDRSDEQSCLDVESVLRQGADYERLKSLDIKAVTEIATRATDGRTICDLWAKRLISEVRDRCGRPAYEVREPLGNIDSLVSGLRGFAPSTAEANERVVVETLWC